MGIDDLFSRYQKKIGTYDKQPWEKTIETKILNCLRNVQLRSTKLNNDLIDLDLIRGSSFTKAKPKHGFMTVARLATLRFLLYPLYSRWWLQHTSQHLYIGFLLLYLSVFLNISIYYVKLSRSDDMSCAEILVPFLMMWVLSLIHSQIVATNPNNDLGKKRALRTRHYRRKRQSRSFHMNLSSPESSSHSRVRARRRINWENSHGEDVDQSDPAEVPQPGRHNLNLEAQGNPIPIDDDGFESLNGNGSRSEEETPNQPPEEEPSPVPVEDRSEQEAHSSSNSSGNKERCDAWLKNAEETPEKFKVQRSSDTGPRVGTSRYSTDSESEEAAKKRPSLSVRRNSRVPVITVIADSTCDDTEEEEGEEEDAEEGEVVSSPETAGSGRGLSGAEYAMGVTTNSEDCSCTSDLDDISDAQVESNHDHMVAASILTPPTAKVSCTMWERREIKKAELTVLDISSAIIAKVESTPNSRDYVNIGLIVSSFLALFPTICRVGNHLLIPKEMSGNADYTQIPLFDFLDALLNRSVDTFLTLLDVAFGTTTWERMVMATVLVQRWVLTVMFFFLLVVAERTFKQRFLYAKLFSHLTSSQRARKYDLPHFRLNKVLNIKAWLSVRSYLKKRGPQRSVDIIVSASFIITLLLISFLCLELLKDTVALNSLYNLEALIWCVGLGALILRFMTLGTKINKKYRNLSVLITEQINLHLQMERKPHKKDELMVANNVLKLAIDLLKELDCPFKISGLSANPILYNITKVIILSALSGILSEMLGFKLKLHKIKLK